MSRFEERLRSFFYDPAEDISGLLDLGEPQATRTAVAEEAPEEYLGFWLGPERYLLPLAAVREVVKVPPLTEVPRAAPDLLGLMRLRGELLPVHDVRERLGLGTALASPAAPDAPPLPVGARVLVLHGEPGPAGMLADGVMGVVRLRPSTLEPPLPGVVRGERHRVRALARVRDVLYVVLGAEGLLA